MHPDRELWFDGPRSVAVRAGAGQAMRALAPGEVRARALASGLSQGTELLLYKGEGPVPFDPSLDAPGTPIYPRRYGYAWVGEIVETASGVKLDRGTRVFALRPHGDVHVLRAEDVRVLPAALPPSRAVLAASLETAVTVVWDAGISLGETVVVLGGGAVGLLCAHLAARSGASRVVVIEPSERRRAAGKALGVETAPPTENSPGAEADVVIEATGDPANLDRAIGHARMEGTIVVASFYGQRRAPVGLGSEFHRRRLTLRSSQVSSVPPVRAGRWDHARRFALVTQLLEDPALDVLLERAVSIEEAPGVFARLDRDPGAALQVVFSYGGAG